MEVGETASCMMKVCGATKVIRVVVLGNLIISVVRDI